VVKIKTPKGTASRVFLARPDTKFDTTGKFRLDLTIPAANAGQIITTLRAVATTIPGPTDGGATMPYVENSDRTITLRFRGKTRPNVYDSRGSMVAPETLDNLHIGTGATLRVIGEASAYQGFGGGVTLYLLEVQVIHLEPYLGPPSGFEADPDGSFIAP
jgi:hypothetical protein